MNRLQVILFSLFCLCCTNAAAQSARLHTQDQMNRTPHEVNSHAGAEQYSSLEPIFGYTGLIKPSILIDPSVPEEQRMPWYPRIKALRDGSYIMFYQGGQVASRVFCSFSNDLRKWSGSKVIYSPYNVKDGGTGDIRRFTTIDAAVLRNGTLLSVVSYRATNGYRQGTGCGLMAARSHDGGRTWTRPNVIYEGPNWEPYILELPDGTVQVYFTDATPRTRNSGTSLIESKDGGVTFGGKTRVMRQFKYYDEGEKIYTDQMPVVKLLNDGKTLMAAVEARLEPEGPGGGSSYFLSLVWNDGWKWKDLGENSEGPADRLTNISQSNAGYLATVPSGEVFLSSGVHGLHSIRIADHTGKVFQNRDWENGWMQPFNVKGVWGSIEAAPDGHHLISVMDTPSKGIQIADSYLNHRIDAPLQETSADGFTGEWLGDEALFIGSDCPTQTIFRAAHDAHNLYILAERVDASIDNNSTISINLCDAAAKKAKKGCGVSLTVGPEGLVQSSDYGKGDAGVQAAVRHGRTAGGERGYAAEIIIPLSSLANAQEIAFYAGVQTGKTTDTFFGARENSPRTWQRIRLTGKEIPAKHKASHSGEEQWSVLQPMYRWFNDVPNEFLLKGLPESATEQKFSCYPRIKKMADGRYILFYMGGRLGSRIWCCTSDDLKNWSEPVMLYSPRPVTVKGEKDVIRYVNMDAAVLRNGDILAVCSFRAAGHYHEGLGCGLLTIRSSDNGLTWSEPQQIYDGPNWEPYLLELPDGRLQCYFTDADPQYWNSGTSMLLSSDGGRSWGNKTRVSRQYKYDYKGKGIYTDQMPCFRVLSDGKTLAGWLESRLETKIPLDYSDKDYYASYCKMSLVLSDGTDWKALGPDEEGPQRRYTNVIKAAGGYVAVFPSGEVAISNGQNSIFKAKLLNSDAQLPDGANWSTDWLDLLPGKGYWGCTEVDSPSTMVVAMHDDEGMQTGRYYLNHRIDASQDGWSKDALYLCTQNGEEARIWSRRSGDRLLLRTSLSEDAILKLLLCAGPGEQVMEITAGAGTSEQEVSLSELGASIGDYVCIYAELSSRSYRSTFTFSKKNDTSKWQRILIK